MCSPLQRQASILEQVSVSILYSEPISIWPGQCLVSLGVTYIALTTRRDFSFLGSILSLGGSVALGIIIASILFGLSLGMFFAGLMVAYAGGAML